MGRVVSNNVMKVSADSFSRARLINESSELIAAEPQLVEGVAEVAKAVAERRERGWVSVFADLFKARLTLLVLITTWVGFYLGYRGPMNYLLMVHAMLGTALVAAGASALNQLLEREHDAKMRRTQDRPLPSGRLQPRTVLVIGTVCSVIGLVYLGLAVNALTCFIGACSLVSYVFIYTPLKRITWLNTMVGAIPGALPPLMGWTAARNELGGEAWALFGIQALWQIPHFMAIAWMYRTEYARAGFKMLPVMDEKGTRTSRQAVGFTLVLFPLALCPFFFGVAGHLYLASAGILGLAFIWYAIQFARELTIPRARQLFYLSILYLPLLLVAMVVDKIS